MLSSVSCKSKAQHLLLQIIHDCFSAFLRIEAWGDLDRLDVWEEFFVSFP